MGKKVSRISEGHRESVEQKRCGQCGQETHDDPALTLVAGGETIIAYCCHDCYDPEMGLTMIEYYGRADVRKELGIPAIVDLSAKATRNAGKHLTGSNWRRKGIVVDQTPQDAILVRGVTSGSEDR